jgi:transcription elongation factor GreA
MSPRLPITAEGLTQLQEELRHLKSVARPEVIRAIAEAREHGDLSENAEYHAARDRQSFIEGRLAELEDKISRSEVIDVSALSGKTVKFGATITVVDEDTDQKLTYQIVGELEADIKAGRLAITAPLARALIGKDVGDSVEVTTPNGEKSYEILKVKFV